MDGAETFTHGNMNAAVVRIGDRVHRTAGPQTATVHRLLTHVRAAGVGWAPEPHGFDEAGREVLDFIPGDVVHALPPWLFDEQVLVAVGRALREWHDATASFAHRPDDVWWQGAIAPVEVVCHVDFAPYNHVFRDGAWVGAIDYDLCTPGPRVWDLAYTAYRYVPLTPHVDDDVPDGDSWGRSTFSQAEQRRRLALFADAYEATGDGPMRAPGVREILAWAPRRLDAMADWCASQESEALRRNGVMYRAHARWVESGPLAH